MTNTLRIDVTTGKSEIVDAVNPIDPAENAKLAAFDILRDTDPGMARVAEELALIQMGQLSSLSQSAKDRIASRVAARTKL